MFVHTIFICKVVDFTETTIKDVQDVKWAICICFINIFINQIKDIVTNSIYQQILYKKINMFIRYNVFIYVIYVNAL